MSARSIEHGKQPQAVIIPETNRGLFAGFQQETPVLMASAFGINVEEHDPASDQGLMFITNAFQWLLTNDEITTQMIATFEKQLKKIGAQTQNVLAATVLAETFGEVKPADRESLGLVAVFNGLQHNIREATQRQIQEIYELSYLIGTIESAIYKTDQEIEKRKEFLKKQQDADLQAKQNFAQNTTNGYMQNAHIGEEAANLAKNLVEESDQEIKELKRQQQMLQGLQFWLNSYLWL